MTWKTFTTETDGKPAIVVMDVNYIKDQPSEQLPKIAWFGVYFNQPPDDGIWAENETEILENIEGDLLKLCEKYSYGWALYLLSISTPGIREYYIYFGGNAELNKVLNELKVLYKDYKFEFDTTDDANWGIYKKWAVLDSA